MGFPYNCKTNSRKFRPHYKDLLKRITVISKPRQSPKLMSTVYVSGYNLFLVIQDDPHPSAVDTFDLVCIFKVLGRVNISGHWRP